MFYPGLFRYYDTPLWIRSRILKIHENSKVDTGDFFKLGHTLYRTSSQFYTFLIQYITVLYLKSFIWIMIFDLWSYGFHFWFQFLEIWKTYLCCRNEAEAWLCAQRQERNLDQKYSRSQNKIWREKRKEGRQEGRKEGRKEGSLLHSIHIYL